MRATELLDRPLGSTGEAASRPQVPVVGPLARPAWESRLALTLVALDAVCMAGLLAVVGPSYAFFVTLVPLWLVAVAASGGYDRRYLGIGSDEYRRVFQAGVRLIALVGLAAFAFRVDIPRAVALMAVPGGVLTDLVARYGARRLLHRGRLQGRANHRVLAVGGAPAVSHLVGALAREPWAGYRVVGACLPGHALVGPTRDLDQRVPVLGDLTQVRAAVGRCGADTVAVTSSPEITPELLRRLSWELEGAGLDLLVAPALTDVAGPRIHVRPVAGLPLLHIEEPRFQGLHRVVKSGSDWVLAVLSLLVLALPLALAALVIRLTSHGPALFRQVRVGRDGRRFTMYKLRTMTEDAEARLSDVYPMNEHVDGPLFKIREDPRVTPVGRWLRRYSLDELPQLFNVVLGQMSLVGPRPPLPLEVARYGDDARRRLLVKPGLTGLWQVSGRADLPWEESVRLDLYYVENWSPALDAMILWKTLWTVLRADGAY
ncbi:MAG: sugar transferase [Mycobacteriales bacterium]